MENYGKLCFFFNGVPYGKHTKNYGKSTINGPFSRAMLNYQRVIMANIAELANSIHLFGKISRLGLVDRE